MELTKQQQAQVANYLAYTHATGKLPARLHTETNWSTNVMLGRDYDLDAMRWVVKPELVPTVEAHPFVVNVARFKEQGFDVRLDVLLSRSRTIKRGIPMVNADTQQRIWVMVDGTVKQTQAVGGRWEWKDNIL